jgi:phosphatidylglycerophosphatase A
MLGKNNLRLPDCTRLDCKEDVRAKIMHLIFRYIATLGFIGYIPFAQGTFASILAFIIFIIAKPSLHLHIVLLLFIIPVGVIASHLTENTLKEKDSRHIVIDEFCGYLLSVLFLPFSLSYAFAALILFRILDILKPFPINKIESSLPGGCGVMADDIAAAVYANLVLQIWQLAA